MTKCKNCGHTITESYKFDYGIPNLERPIMWEHIDDIKMERIRGIRCDAIYHGLTCMNLKGTGIENAKVCGCNKAEPSPYNPESKSYTALKLLQAYREYIIKVTMLDK